MEVLHLLDIKVYSMLLQWRRLKLRGMVHAGICKYSLKSCHIESHAEPTVTKQTWCELDPVKRV